MEKQRTLLERLTRGISNMVLVLVMLLGSPPIVTIWERMQRPAIARVMPLRRRGARGGAGPAFPLPGDAPDGPPAPDDLRYIPVRAA